MVETLQTKLKYSALLGLTPYGRGKSTLRYQRWYGSILLFGLIARSVYGLNVTGDIDDTKIVSNLVGKLIFILHLIVLTIVMLEAMFTYEQYFHWLRFSRQIRQLFARHLRFQMIHKTYQKYCIYLGVMLAALAMSTIIMLWRNYSVNFWYSFPVVFMLRIRCLQLIVYVDCIADYMEALKVKLSSVCNCRVVRDFRVLDVDYAHLCSPEYLQQLKFIYKEVYNFTMRFNDLYGWSLFLLTTVTLLEIIVINYWVVLILSNFYKMELMYYNISINVPPIFSGVMLCYSCHCL